MKKIALIGLAAASIIALAACGSAPGTSKGGSEKGNTIGKTFKIGLNMELSGAYAAPGNAEKMLSNWQQTKSMLMEVLMVKKFS